MQKFANQLRNVIKLRNRGFFSSKDYEDLHRTKIQGHSDYSVYSTYRKQGSFQQDYEESFDGQKSG